jgi:hypothetical protein
VSFVARDGDLAIIITGGDSREVFTNANAPASRVAVVARADTVDQNLPGWRGRVGNGRPEFWSYQALLSEEEEIPFVELIDGTPRVFCHLLAMVHRPTTDGVEEDITDLAAASICIEELRDIAKLSHEYGALRWIAPYVPAWVEKLIPKDWEPERDPDLPSYHLEYLWVAYEFGMKDLFNEVCFNLAYVATFSFEDPDLLPPKISCEYRTYFTYLSQPGTSNPYHHHLRSKGPYTYMLSFIRFSFLFFQS